MVVVGLGWAAVGLARATVVAVGGAETNALRSTNPLMSGKRFGKKIGISTRTATINKIAASAHNNSSSPRRLGAPMGIDVSVVSVGW